jgi:hypothetical protein
MAAQLAATQLEHKQHPEAMLKGLQAQRCASVVIADVLSRFISTDLCKEQWAAIQGTANLQCRQCQVQCI